jgi:hypothetical protein
MFFLNCSCCSSSRALRVGPGYLICIALVTSSRDGPKEVIRQVLDPLWFLEVLKILEVRDKLGFLKHFLVGQLVQIEWVAQQLHELLLSAGFGEDFPLRMTNLELQLEARESAVV